MSNQVCEHCLDLKEIPGTPTGKYEPVAGIQSYVKPGSKKGTVLLATDIFGLAIPNPALLADKYSEATGFTVVVPDLFRGDPINPKDFNLRKHAQDKDPQPMDAAFGAFMAWLGKDHGPDNSYPIISKLIEHYAPNGPIAISGYCYGAKLAVLAAAKGGAASPVKGIVLNHPSMLEPAEAKEIKVPTLLNMAEFDPIFTPEVKTEWTKTLEANNVLDPASKTYPGTVHGFTCRPDLSRPELKQAYESAAENTVKFFSKVLA